MLNKKTLLSIKTSQYVILTAASLPIRSQVTSIYKTERNSAWNNRKKHPSFISPHCTVTSTWRYSVFLERDSRTDYDSLKYGVRNCLTQYGRLRHIVYWFFLTTSLHHTWTIIRPNKLEENNKILYIFVEVRSQLFNPFSCESHKMKIPSYIIRPHKAYSHKNYWRQVITS